MRNQIRTELSSENIIIRKIRMEDTELLAVAVKESLDELSLWMPWATPNYNRSDSKEFITYSLKAWEDETEYSFFVFDKESKKLIGGCGLNQIDKQNRKANLGYWIRSSETGKGYATKAALLAAWFGLEDLKMNRIEIIASTENLASLKVAKRTGAHKEAILKRRIMVKNNAHDAALYAIFNLDIKDIKLRLNRF